MRVAIIGAGLGGLYCACKLEQYGIYPDIYEKHNSIGEVFSHVIAILDITHRPVKDFVKYVKKNIGIDIVPLNTVNSLMHHSPHITTTLKGSFGYFFKVSKDESSIMSQLSSKLTKSKIYFNEFVDYELLSKKYDYVIVANGNSLYAEELGLFQQWMKTYVRGAVVLGDFNPNELIMWINKDYTKNGYAYLTPFDSTKASLVLITTDVNEEEIDRYWELFLYTENFKYTFVEEFKMEHKSGYVYPSRYNNIFFVGNAGGGVEPFLGFGHLNAVTMAFSAARTIAKGCDYEKQLKDIIDRNLYMREFRKAFNKSTNAGYDKVVAALKIPGVKQMIYDTNLNVGSIGGFLLKYLLNDKSKP